MKTVRGSVVAIALLCLLVTTAVAQVSVRDAVVILDLVKTVPWDEIGAALKAAGGAAEGATKEVKLERIEGRAELVVASADVRTQVTKWQEEWYGSITLAVDVKAKVKYGIDLSEVRIVRNVQRGELVISLPAPKVSSVELDKERAAPSATFTRLRKWFSSDTRSALEKELAKEIDVATREEAAKHAAQVQNKLGKEFQSAAESKLKLIQGQENLRLRIEFRD